VSLSLSQKSADAFSRVKVKGPVQILQTPPGSALDVGPKADVRTTPEVRPPGLGAVVQNRSALNAVRDGGEGNNMRIPFRGSVAVIGKLVLCAAALVTFDIVPAQHRPWIKGHTFALLRGSVPSVAALAPAPGRVKVNPKDGLKYAWIAPGAFRMGCSPGDEECSDDEKPSHPVKISKGFWMGQTEVTVAAYKRFVRAAGKTMPAEPELWGRPLNIGWKNEAMPIVNVNWDESQGYCAWVGGRLPTDAEWEYAARGGNPGARYGPPDEIAWYADNSGRQRLDSTQLKIEDKKKYGGGRKIMDQRLKENGNGMREVGQKRPNTFGLFDMFGNVWEWVDGWYDPNYYRVSPSQDPPGPASGQLRLVRGASWDDVPAYLRVSYPHKCEPELRNYTLGFRCVWEAPKP
jgi:sulfatase modifying factor 1